MLAPQQALKPYAKVQSSELNEISGIVESQSSPGTYWVHNDSGDSARIFAIDSAGKSLTPGGVTIEGAHNRDWEDIAIGGGNLYISDLGNNGNTRKNLVIYEVPEPNVGAKTAKFKRKIRVSYPDQTDFPPPVKRQFDSEAIFWLRGKLYVITKHRIGGFIPDITASLYRMDATLPPPTVNRLTKLDTAKDLGGWVTGADVSPSGKKLAVLVHAPNQSVWVFDATSPDGKFFTKGKGRQIKLTGLKQIEAICFDSEGTVIVTNETGDLYKIAV